jgi:hypothetical protein
MASSTALANAKAIQISSDMDGSSPPCAQSAVSCQLNSVRARS